MATFAEQSEDSVTGELARVYEEIRITYGAPYVSSLQRHLATYPGVLEWAWSIVSPGFHSGLIPEIARQVAHNTDHEPAADALDRKGLAKLGVDQHGLEQIRNICENFVRVAPMNLLFAGCIRAVLEGADLPDAQQSISQRKRPVPLQPMPPMLAPDTLANNLANDLAKLSTDLDDQTFTPGLYRMLVHWPGYLSHVASLVGPRLKNPEFQIRGEYLAQRVVDAVPMVLNALPPPPPLPAPDPSLVPHLMQATMTYRRTSPEMVLVGTLLLQQLPTTGAIITSKSNN